MKADPIKAETMARLDRIVRTAFGVSHEEILRREAEYKRKADINPQKRGPKPKDRRSA